MTGDGAPLADRLAALEVSAIAVWVFDPARCAIVWANAAAVDLWRARDRDELLARFVPVSETTRAQMDGWMIDLRAGGTLIHDWTFHPRGVPTPVRVHVTAIALDDGGVGMLSQALPREHPPDPDALRGGEALRHAPAVVCLLDRHGEVLFRNPAAIHAFGHKSTPRDWFDEPAIAAAILDVFSSRDVFRAEVSAQVAGEVRCFALEARPILDPVSGADTVLLQLVDETARRGAERAAETEGRRADELARALHLVETQRRRILELSAPVLRIGHDALAVPIIGALAESRVVELADRLLAAVAAHTIRGVVLDLTGVGEADEGGVASLGRLARALRLLGAHVFVTGVMPPLARALIAEGAQLEGARVLRNLADGLKACMTTQ